MLTQGLGRAMASPPRVEASFRFRIPADRVLELPVSACTRAMNELRTHCDWIKVWGTFNDADAIRYEGAWAKGHESQGARALNGLFAMLWPERFIS